MRDDGEPGDFSQGPWVAMLEDLDLTGRMSRFLQKKHLAYQEKQQTPFNL